MLQLVGSLILIGSMGALGLVAASRLNREADQLEEIVYGLNVLCKEIVYGHTRLPIALQNAARGLSPAVEKVFKRAGTAMVEQELLPREAFLVAINQAAGWESEAAVPILLRLAYELGTSSCEEQERFIKLACEELRAQYERARSKAATQGKVYRWGGFLLGGMLTLLMI